MLRESLVQRLLAAGAFSALCFTTLQAQAKIVTLQHDTLVNNDEAVAVCGFAVGEKLAASFTPPAYPAKLIKVQILLTNAELSASPPCPSAAVASNIQMPLEVFNLTDALPGASLGVFDGFAFSNDKVLNEIDVAASKLTIDDGAFLLAYSISQTNASPVHDGSNAAHNDENFIYANLGQGESWYSFSDLSAYGLDPNGDWVIRIDVDVPDDPPDGGAGGAAGSGGSAGTGGAAGTAGTGGTGTAGTGGASADCANDTDCDGGQVCDTDLGRCVPKSTGGTSGGGDDDGGCAVGPSPSGSYGFLAGALALVLVWHRRRRRE